MTILYRRHPRVMPLPVEWAPVVDYADGGGYQAPPGLPMLPASNGSPSTSGGSTSTGSGGFDLSSLFGGGNNTLLLIGAAVVAWMIFGKKR